MALREPPEYTVGVPFSTFGHHHISELFPKHPHKYDFDLSQSVSTRSVSPVAADRDVSTTATSTLVFHTSALSCCLALC